MGEPDEALLWARGSSVSKTYANIHSLAQAYRAGADLTGANLCGAAITLGNRTWTLKEADQ